MTPAFYRTWIPLSLGAHAVLLAILALIRVPAPDDRTKLVPIRVVAAEPVRQPAPTPAPKPTPKPVIKPVPPPPKPAPKPRVVEPVVRPQPRPAVRPQPTPSARPAARPGRPDGQRSGVALTPGGGGRTGKGTTSPAPPAVMSTPGGKGRPAPPGIPGGTGTQGTGTEPAGPSSGPVRLGGPVPSYPKLAEEEGEEGTVTVRVTISASGDVESATVSSSSGHASLDAAALRAARNWRFKPALKNGTPVTSTETIRFRFANGSVSGG